MPDFARNNAIVLTWTSNACHVLGVRRAGEQVAVQASWSGQTSKERSLAELLAEGVRSVGGDDNVFLVAGGDGLGWGTADVEMPALKPEELKHALAFELRRLTPIPAERLQWGYRLLPKTDKKAEKIPLRLLYVKREKLTKWLDALGGLHHLDAIIPPSATLSPLFAGESIILPEGDGHFFRYTDDHGTWLVKPETPASAPTFQDALPRNAFDFGTLGSLPPEEQAAWLPALVLGAYALSHAAGEDAATLLPVPENLRPHRNQMLKLLAACLVGYVVLVLAIGLGRQFQKRRSYLRQVESEYRTVQARIAELKKLNSQVDVDFGNTLRQEILDNRPQGPDFPDVLAELSRLITPPAWISQRLEWNSGLVTMQLVSPTKDLDLAGKLEESAILGDVREQSSSFSQNQYTTRFTLNARLDTPEEAEALHQRREARAAKQAEASQAAPNGSEDDADESEETTATDTEDVEENGQAAGAAEEAPKQN